MKKSLLSFVCGVSVSTFSGIIVWLFLTTNQFCIQISDTTEFQPAKCTFEPLLISITRGAWPYDEQHNPPYVDLILIIVGFFLVWLVISFYFKWRHGKSLIKT
ncbi:MAG: hypothetical protein ACREAU_06030, partial [Nitrosopumilaceae archaeon]